MSAERRFDDRLSVLGLRFIGRHGAIPEERERPQRFEVDVVLYADLGPAAASDDLDATADYREVVEAARSVLEGPSLTLIEAIASAVARRVLATTSPRVVDAVEVRVRKPDAPLDADLDTVEAALTVRRRS
jgi:dihydroneopterin aldolase